MSQNKLQGHLCLPELNSSSSSLIVNLFLHLEVYKFVQMALAPSKHTHLMVIPSTLCIALANYRTASATNTRPTKPRNTTDSRDSRTKKTLRYPYASAISFRDNTQIHKHHSGAVEQHSQFNIHAYFFNYVFTFSFSTTTAIKPKSRIYHMMKRDSIRLTQLIFSII